jgi:hypothetical protein
LPAAGGSTGGNGDGTDDGTSSGGQGGQSAPSTTDTERGANPLDAILREPAALVQRLVDDVAESVAGAVRPAAVKAVAEAFTFPLILMVAVLLFLLGQSRMDDPKFRMAPLDKTDTTVAFLEEARI